MRDAPDAELHLLGADHFALAEVARPMLEFLARARILRGLCPRSGNQRLGNLHKTDTKALPS